MIKVRIIQNKTHEFEDEGKMVSYDMDESIEFTAPALEAVQDLIDTIVTYGDNARIEITKVKED